MKGFFAFSTILMVFSASVLSVPLQNTGWIKGRAVDPAGMPIPNVRITIQSSSDSFKAVSDENGYFEIQVPTGSYEVGSEKLPGFAATKRNGVRVEASKIVEIDIAPVVSTEGILCSLYITAAPTKKQRKRKRHR